MRGRREAERRQKGSRTEAGWSDICRRDVIEWRTDRLSSIRKTIIIKKNKLVGELYEKLVGLNLLITTGSTDALKESAANTKLPFLSYKLN